MCFGDGAVIATRDASAVCDADGVMIAIPLILLFLSCGISMNMHMHMYMHTQHILTSVCLYSVRAYVHNQKIQEGKKRSFTQEAFGGKC